MPTLVTADFKGKELYFDLRQNGIGDKPEGFRATPIFESERREITRKAEANGKVGQAWIEQLVLALKGWEGFIDLAGKEISCSEDNIRALCESDPGPMMSYLGMIHSAAIYGKVIAEKN